ncbi:hypothetical protein M422DRAFT_56632 [Sphaerobolus stellatus SS14]|uniref:Uncharacterized protein n=1 Tax=Sphaerobolus stellatus (strain SS14) TaxID=990650 RepID=A0A0C9UFJ9_SPHS4|nr:hypothetical protein M422DRAFT_56632 [Sphaerobolus stellatus SS14]
MAALEPKSPAIVPTLDGMVPQFRILTTRTGVLFGSGPLNKVAGDSMTAQGVSIFILYGSTEGGIMNPVLPVMLVNWHIYHLSDYIDSLINSNSFCKPSVINTNIDAYTASDLFTSHPTKTGYWRVHGRTNDQTMHNTGEKTNLGPLDQLNNAENKLNQDSHVIASVMFGRGRFQAGIIVDPKPTF